MSGNLPPGVTDAMIDRLHDEPPPQCRECDDIGCPACDAEIADGYARSRATMSETRTAADERVIIALRDWFAGQALAGIIASYANPGAFSVPEHEIAAKGAYQYADAMLAARSATT